MTLIRKKKHTVKYYSIMLYPTLFDEFLVVQAGGLHCSSRSKRSYFKSRKEAVMRSLTIIAAKKAEGFELR